MSAQDYVSVRFVAERLGISRSLVYDMVRRGEIENVSAARRRVLISRRWLNEHYPECAPVQVIAQGQFT